MIRDKLPSLGRVRIPGPIVAGTGLAAARDLGLGLSESTPAVAAHPGLFADLADGLRGILSDPSQQIHHVLTALVTLLEGTGRLNPAKEVTLAESVGFRHRDATLVAGAGTCQLERELGPVQIDADLGILEASPASVAACSALLHVVDDRLHAGDRLGLAIRQKRLIDLEDKEMSPSGLIGEPLVVLGVLGQQSAAVFVREVALERARPVVFRQPASHFSILVGALELSEILDLVSRHPISPDKKGFPDQPFVTDHPQELIRLGYISSHNMAFNATGQPNDCTLLRQSNYWDRFVPFVPVFSQIPRINLTEPIARYKSDLTRLTGYSPVFYRMFEHLADCVSSGHGLYPFQSIECFRESHQQALFVVGRLFDEGLDRLDRDRLEFAPVNAGHLLAEGLMTVLVHHVAAEGDTIRDAFVTIRANKYLLHDSLPVSKR